MAHHVYSTNGFIISSSPRGEASKYFYIFTRDLGMVGAAAQGVRLNHSKLRYHTQDYTRGIFSLVRGKEIWRLTGAMRDEDTFQNDEQKELYIQLLTLLRRLLKGEEAHPALFDTLESSVNFLITAQKEDLKQIEYVSVLRILYHLGYVSRTLELEPFLSDNTWSTEMLINIDRMKAVALKAINNGLKESQL